MRGANVFSKIDLGSYYQQVSIKDEDVHRTTFMERYGFTNAPTMFICLRNNFFSRYLGKYVLIFLDDIPNYSKDEEKHVEQLRLTLKLLRKHQLYARLSNYDFYKDGIHYLGHLILDKRISIELGKIGAMRCWCAPRKLTYVKYFVGLAGYYRRFTEEYFAGKIESMYGLRKLACELVVP